MPEFSDLPLNIHQMIAEVCNLRSRINMRLTSKSLLEIVDTSSFYIPELILQTDGVSLKITNEEGYSIRKNVEDPEARQSTTKFLRELLKKANIGNFTFRGSEDQDDDSDEEEAVEDHQFLVEEILMNLKANISGPLSIHSLNWAAGKVPFEIFGICDAEDLKSIMLVGPQNPNFFSENFRYLKDLEKVHIMNSSCDATDDQVLQMTSKEIVLESENFSAKMINELIEKFIAKGIDEVAFIIRNRRENFTKKIGIPQGFERERYNRYEKIGQFYMQLQIDRNEVIFAVEPL